MRPSFATWRAGGYANSAIPRPADPSRLQKLAGRTMGTTWSLVFDNPSMRPHEAVLAAIKHALDTVVDQMSTWETASDISRYNQAPAGSRHLLADDFARVLGCALEWAKASGGAVDPTVGPLVALWGFGAHANATIAEPTAAAVADAKSRTGWERLGFDLGTQTITQPGGLSLDLSGVAKGFAVDKVAEALLALGLGDFLVEIGGELRGVGIRPGGQAWRVRIDVAEDALPPVALKGMAIATSGDRWHVHEQGGRRWSHTIDPRSGEPLSATLASVTVLHAQCMHADALATALLVLGASEGPAFAERHRIAAAFVRRNGDVQQVLATEAWRAFSA
ncbi:MAG: FAD:protein FMN transferase [Pseudomonadota bacterium]